MKVVKLGMIGLAGALAVTAIAVAQPAPPTPEQQAANAVSTRQAVFKLISWNMGPMGGMLRTAPYDAAVVRTNAQNIANLAPMIPGLFASDTTAFDVETRAADAVWTSKDDFDAKAAALIEAANAVVAAADDEAAAKAAIGALGGACGSCHDTYRPD